MKEINTFATKRAIAFDEVNLDTMLKIINGNKEPKEMVVYPDNRLGEFKWFVEFKCIDYEFYDIIDKLNETKINYSLTDFYKLKNVIKEEKVAES